VSIPIQASVVTHDARVLPVGIPELVDLLLGLAGFAEFLDGIPHPAGGVLLRKLIAGISLNEDLAVGISMVKAV
jgi:hypothetical protein